MLQFDMFAVGKVDALFHAGANDDFAELFVIAVMKMVPGKLPFDFVADGHEKSRDVVPKKVYELVVGDDDQYIGPSGFEVFAQRRKGMLGVLPEFFLLFEGGPARRTLRRHAVVKIHEIFPFPAGFKKNIGGVARCQGGY
jgi:hypothetical protein